MKRLATPTVVFAVVIAVLAGCAGAAGQRPATVQELAGTWHGSVAGREVLGGGLALPAECGRRGRSAGLRATSWSLKDASFRTVARLEGAWNETVMAWLAWCPRASSARA